MSPPLYLYRCPRCGSHLEELAPMAKGKRKAPLCVTCRVLMKRKYGDIAIQFKGEGWTSPGPRAKKEP